MFSQTFKTETYHSYYPEGKYRRRRNERPQVKVLGLSDVASDAP